MNRSNNIYEFLTKLLKKIFPYIFAINALFIWGIIFIFFYESFNNFFGYILCVVSIAISVYSHSMTIDYLENKYNIKDDDQN